MHDRCGCGPEEEERRRLDRWLSFHGAPRSSRGGLTTDAARLGHVARYRQVDPHPRWPRWILEIVLPTPRRFEQADQWPCDDCCGEGLDEEDDDCFTCGGAGVIAWLRCSHCLAEFEEGDGCDCILPEDLPGDGSEESER